VNTKTITNIIKLRQHPRTLRRDTAILDLLELIEMDLVPGILSTATLARLLQISRSQVSRRLAAIHDLPGWRVQQERGRGALAWIGPTLMPTARERWEQLREVMR
jgi:hypothetical protein